MALVGYSDSEGSEDETPKVPSKLSASTKPSNTKSTFQKFTDSTNPRKIKVNLPSIATTTQDATKEDDEPPTKRAKMSGGGFNAMLPAPKRSKASLAVSGRGKGLGSGISLKTGATPGFSREVPEPMPVEESEEISTSALDSSRTGLEEDEDVEAPVPEVPLKKGNPMVFKPLSVSRKPKKKSAAALMPAMSSSTESVAAALKPKPKVSLFSTVVPEAVTPELSTGTYKPMIHTTTSAEVDDELQGDLPDALYPSQGSISNQARPEPESLSSIATSLNLSASQRRQLMGRKGAGFENANVAVFNTESEYAQNEELRARGDTATFNPVRAHMGGKASLQSMISSVTNQREALEDSFAAGRRNKKEAGAKYGWS